MKKPKSKIFNGKHRIAFLSVQEKEFREELDVCDIRPAFCLHYQSYEEFHLKLYFHLYGT